MRERLIELIESARCWGANTSEEIADRLLAEGVIVQPCEAVQKVSFASELYEKALAERERGNYDI